jgi:hypothetical protein
LAAIDCQVALPHGTKRALVTQEREQPSRRTLPRPFLESRSETSWARVLAEASTRPKNGGTRGLLAARIRTGVTMAKAPKIEEFGAGWPREMLLAYDLRVYVTNTLGCTELLQESKLSPRDSKQVKMMRRQMEAAVVAVEELYQIFCAPRARAAGRAGARGHSVPSRRNSKP